MIAFGTTSEQKKSARHAQCCTRLLPCHFKVCKDLLQRLVGDTITLDDADVGRQHLARTSWVQANIGALIITYIILGVPYYYNYSRMGPETLF